MIWRFGDLGDDDSDDDDDDDVERDRQTVRPPSNIEPGWLPGDTHELGASLVRWGLGSQIVKAYSSEDSVESQGERARRQYALTREKIRHEVLKSHDPARIQCSPQ